MLLLVKLALASYPYIGHDTFCTDVSPIGWSCKEKVAIADAWTDPDVPGAVTAADGAADGVTALSLSAESFNTCPGAPVGPATNLVNDLCGTAAECGAGQALPFGQQWSSCGGASIVDNTGLIGALEAYGTADTILPTRRSIIHISGTKIALASWPELDFGWYLYGTGTQKRPPGFGGRFW